LEFFCLKSTNLFIKPKIHFCLHQNKKNNPQTNQITDNQYTKTKGVGCTTLSVALFISLPSTKIKPLFCITSLIQQGLLSSYFSIYAFRIYSFPKTTVLSKKYERVSEKSKLFI